MNKNKIQDVINTIKAVFNGGGVIGFENADMLIGCVIALSQMISEEETEGESNVLDRSGNPDA